MAVCQRTPAFPPIVPETVEHLAMNSLIFKDLAEIEVVDLLYQSGFVISLQFQNCTWDPPANYRTGVSMMDLQNFLMPSEGLKHRTR